MSGAMETVEVMVGKESYVVRPACFWTVFHHFQGALRHDGKIPVSEAKVLVNKLDEDLLLYGRLDPEEDMLAKAIRAADDNDVVTWKHER